MNFKIIFITIFYSITSPCSSQQYNTSFVAVTSDDLIIVGQTTSFTYSGNSYVPFTPDWNFYNNALTTMQARYDYNYQRINGEYGKLLKLKLINPENQKILNEYQIFIDNKIKNTHTDNIDWSIDKNANSYLNFITQVYKIESIKSEIKLLQNIQYELIRIKYKDPDNFYHSKRYEELISALRDLKNSGASEINNIAWKYGLM